MAKLFNVGLPKDMQEIRLVELFSAHGVVNTITIVTDKATGASKGYGFVTMNDDAGAQRAIAALNGGSIGGRTISVRFAEGKNTKPDTAPGFKKPFNNRLAPSRPDQPKAATKTKRPRRPPPAIT
jgi:RNA recognition motif-containing protein